MGLLKKKKEIQQEPQFFPAKCPNCGKEFTLPFYHFKWRLDGTPNIPIDKRMESFIVCECGMLVTHDALPVVRLSSEEYQHALQQKGKTIQKLKTLYALTHDESILLWFAHYYNETGNTAQESEFCQAAIDSIIQKHDRKIFRIQHNELDALTLNTEYTMYPEDRLVDLYRRTGQWEKALQIIQELRHQQYGAYPYARFAVLDMQEKLLKARDSSVK